MYRDRVPARSGDGGESVRGEVAAALYPFLRAAYSAAGVLAFAVTLATEIPSGRSSPSLWAQSGTFLLTALAVWLPVRRAVGASLITGGLLVMGLFALLRYGPLGGSALIFVSAAFVASVNMGRKGASVVGVIGLVAYVAVAALIVSGRSPPPDPAGYVPGRASTWIRAGVSIFVIAAALLFLFERFVSALEGLAERIAASRLALEAAEQERERALTALAGSQRLASLGQLAAGASHDFRNALIVILTGIAEARRLAPGGPADEVLGDVERAAWAAEGTARHLVTFGRPGAQEGDLCDPSHVVEGVARTLGRVLPKSIVVRAETVSTGLVRIGGGTLSQAILNLALNARDAMPEGGRLTIRALADGHGAGVEVSDSGAGMDPETLARASEPFFTTKERTGGTGLGLAMVRDVVERAGGELSIRSRRGEGTSVRLWLPRGRRGDAEGPRPGEPGNP